MSECPKGGRHVPAFPADVENGWIIHRCKKCGTELSRYPKRKKAAMLKNLARAAAVTVAAAGLVLATSQIAHADTTFKGFCVNSGNGDCVDYNNDGGGDNIPSIDPYDSRITSTVLRAGAGGGCNHGKVATMSADGCWWPFTTHSFDTDYHNDVIVSLVFNPPDSCIAAQTSDNTVRNTDCGGGGTSWVRDGDFGYVSVSDSDHQGSHIYLKRVSRSGTAGTWAGLGAWVAVGAQWAFCHDTASGCVNGQ